MYLIFGLYLGAFLHKILQLKFTYSSYPRTGGNSVRYVMSYCFKAVLACETDADRHDAKVRTFLH